MAEKRRARDTSANHPSDSAMNVERLNVQRQVWLDQSLAGSSEAFGKLLQSLQGHE